MRVKAINEAIQFDQLGDEIETFVQPRHVRAATSAIWPPTHLRCTCKASALRTSNFGAAKTDSLSDYKLPSHHRYARKAGLLPLLKDDRIYKPITRIIRVA